MHRRRFVLPSGIGAVAELSECLGGTTPPAGKSNAITDFEVNDWSLDIATLHFTMTVG